MRTGACRAAAVALAFLLVADCSRASPTTTPVDTSDPAADRPVAPLAGAAGTLVAMVVVYPDVSRVPVSPEVAIYADGSVYTPGDRTPGSEHARFAVRRLTPEGLAAVREAFATFVGDGGEVGTRRPPELGSGIARYAVTTLRDGRLITRSTTSEHQGPAATELQAFVDRWGTPATAMAGLTWESPAPVPYVADRFAVWLWLSDDCCRDTTLADALEIEPILGPLVAFGQAREPGNPAVRCGHVDGAAQRALAVVLSAHKRRALSHLDWIDADVNLGQGVTSLAVIPMLPGFDGCTDLAG